MSFILENEGTLRLVAFAMVFVIMAVLELALPAKQRVLPRIKRWVTNLALIGLGSIILKVSLPFMAVGLAFHASDSGWGLFNWTTLPLWAEISLSILLLDFFIYWQHVATHKIPFLWALHKVHHSDRDVDVSTGIRFHPVEILFSMCYKFLCVLLIGPHAVAVILFEILLNISALFNHANMRITPRLEPLIRWFVVTPAMHRIHHSTLQKETNSNYGFFLSVWDRCFASYTSHPEKGNDSMTIGLDEYQTDKPSSLTWSLLIPFTRENR